LAVYTIVSEMHGHTNIKNSEQILERQLFSIWYSVETNRRNFIK